jgi:AraC family transcriptional regulator, regulatory protein of adaptative response / methylated-DNA-[protein]-cysteine methyltransferase
MKLLLQPKPDRRKDYAADEAKWQAVVAKDHRADGRFYYSVKTTGVYCRPSCPARPALRKNVVFHSSSADAEQAGFRACKRCSPAGRTLAQEHTAAVAKACRIVENSEELLPLEGLAKRVGMSRFHFHRVFKAITGLTPRAYAVANRSQRVRKKLTRTGSVTQAIYDAGFNSNGRFYAKSSETLGMTPKSFKAGGTGATIRFAVGECSLGSILVATSEIGVCAILMGDNPDTLVRDLQDRFNKAKLIGGDRDFEKTVAKVVGFIEAPRVGFDLPLDVRGTAFQQRVWQALRQIPVGSTASYTEVAARIGRPKAARAVAQACGANGLAVAIPCHRVLRIDGNLSGYRWGVERKRALLEREKEVA